MNDPTMMRTNSVSVHHHPYRPATNRAQLILREAQEWIAFVLERSGWRAETAYRKALESTAFSLDRGTRAFAVPSKVAGTRESQEALAALGSQHFHCLVTQSIGDKLVVSAGGAVLGHIQEKHTVWLFPLLSHGASVYLLQVTGTSRDGGYLGCNVAFGHIGQAIRRSRGAIQETRGIHEEERDVLLWRAPDGSCRTNIQHVVRHSPTGIAWGYSGSGPADLARSILLWFTGLEEANRLYQSFKEEVVARVPPMGGRITADLVESWLEQRRSAG